MGVELCEEVDSGEGAGNAVCADSKSVAGARERSVTESGTGMGLDSAGYVEVDTDTVMDSGLDAGFVACADSKSVTESGVGAWMESDAAGICEDMVSVGVELDCGKTGADTEADCGGNECTDAESSIEAGTDSESVCVCKSLSYGFAGVLSKIVKVPFKNSGAGVQLQRIPMSWRLFPQAIFSVWVCRILVLLFPILLPAQKIRQLPIPCESSSSATGMPSGCESFTVRYTGHFPLKRSKPRICNSMRQPSSRRSVRTKPTFLPRIPPSYS